MKASLFGILLTVFGAIANAATYVLDPGPGTDYLAVSCGGQTVNEIATGFDAVGNALTLVKVSTTCHGSGRGSPNQYYLACWTVGFGRDGSITSKVWLATYHWQQGQPSIPCPVTADPAAVFSSTDGAGSFAATLSSAPVGTSTTVFRAVLETSCGTIAFGESVTGTIGAAGNTIRAAVARTSGSLVPALEVRRPDGSTLCGTASGSVDCVVDATGLYHIVVRDAAGSGTGGYELTLVRTDLPAHLTIVIGAGVAPTRFASTITYRITVGNDGGLAATGVVVTDTLPQGLAVRSLATTQGSCSRVARAVTCTLGDIAGGGQATVTIVTATALSETQVSDTACVASGPCATVTTSLP